jgi:hypothetical protein
MKKIIYSLLIALILPFSALAQTQEAGDIYKIWTNPVVYNFDEQVSWYFDLTGTTFTQGQDIYIWIWSPTEPDAGNWENSSDFAKLTYVEEMIWRFDLTPTLYFNQTPDQIAASAGFWLRLKDKAGTLQSGVSNVPITDFSGFAGSGEQFKQYPEKFYINEPMSILFNSKLLENFEGATSVHMHAGLNNWEIQQEYQAWLPEIVEKTKLVDIGNGIYRKDIIPAEYFNAPEGYVMNVINFLFVKDDWAATSPDYILYAPDVPIPPDPVLSFFPLKVSVNDFLIITRLNNLPGQRLSYSLTGGSTNITGEFTGNMESQKAFINLLGNFGSMDITKLSVSIKDQLNNVIFEGDLPLVKKD